MFETPSPTHGFLPVILAFNCYLLAVLVALYGLWQLGVPDIGLLVALPVVGGVLLKAFVPLFRRLTPDAVETE